MWRVAAALLALAACPSSHADDSVQAQLKTPVGARVVVREHEEPVACDGVTGFVERLECVFRSNVTRCAWLEVDSPELAAQPLGADLAACRGLKGRGPRVALGEPPSGGFLLAADATGARLAVKGGPAGARVFYVLDGIIVGEVVATWPVNWSIQRPLDRAVADLLSGAAGDTDVSNRLIEYALKSGGEAALVELMEVMNDDALDRWSELYDRLEDEAKRREVLDALHQRMREEPTLELIGGAIAYPDLQPKDFQQLLRTAAGEALTGSYDWYTLDPLLAELSARKDPAAGELGCRIYGMHVLSEMQGGADQYDEEGDPTATSEALELVASSNAPCPWPAIALENDPCSADLRCELDGGLPDEVDDPTDDAAPDPSITLPQPLCSRAVADSAVGRHDVENDEPAMRQGALLLSAAWARHGVSAELLLRNARRRYRYQYPDAGDDAEAADEELPCRRPRSLPEAVCRLPPGVTTAEYNGCRLRIDDHAKVVRVEELRPAK